jgi:hypothetical protein
MPKKSEEPSYPALVVALEQRIAELEARVDAMYESLEFIIAILRRLGVNKVAE